MRKLPSSILACFIFFTTFTFFVPEAVHARSDEWVNGYVKKNGTMVQPYRRTTKDKIYNNNYSTRGNYNPYHGKRGTKPRDEDVWRSRRHKYSSRAYGF